MKNLAKTISIILITACILTSCNKADTTTNALSTKESFLKQNNIPYYESHEELSIILKEATSFEDVDELIQYEKKQNRMSIGAEADSFYRTIQPENLGTTQAMINFYIAHSDLLDTTATNNEISISPKWFSTPYRYAANRAGLFAVGNYIYQLSKTGISSANIGNINDSVSLDGIVFFNKDTSNEKSNTKQVSHAGCFLPWVLADTLKVGDDRVIVELCTEVIGPQGACTARTRVHTYSQHKWALIWWTSQHTLTCQGSVTWHRKTGSDSWDYGTNTINETQQANSMWSYIHDEPCYWGVGMQYYHYYSFNLKARTPSLAYASLVWNTNS